MLVSGPRFSLRANFALLVSTTLLSSCDGIKPTETRPPVPPGGTGSCQISAQVISEPSGPFLSVGGVSQGLSWLGGHIPHQARAMTDQGKMNEAETLSVTIALKLNFEAELDQRLREMYEPGNPNFHRFMTPSEFQARYSPTEDQLNQVKAFLKSQGIEPVSSSENRLLLHAKGKLRRLNSVFHTEVHRYQGTHDESYFAPAYEFQVPAGLPIQAIHGLQNMTRLRTHAIRSSTVDPQAATGPGGGFSPSDIRTAYNIPKNANGSGETLALFELDGYLASDIAAYVKTFQLPQVPLKNILVGGFGGTAGPGAGEVTLDIELMIALAPAVRQILVYEGPNTDQGVLATYSRIASDNLARQVSTSWGISEDQTSPAMVQTENSIFKQMAAQGQTVFAAAGDSGAYDNGRTLGVDDPASQPYVVSVGGTRLATHSDGTYQSETVWNADGIPQHGAGGGGISSIWSIPPWQTGVATLKNLGSTRMRNIPDVALDADPATGYSIFSGGVWNIYGGTSCGSPLWAAYASLVNQERQLKGLSALGFPSPALYQIGRGSQYSYDFFDIADGSTNIRYPAVSGYDNASGWGSFNGQNLLDDLASDPIPSPSGSSAGGSTPGCP